MTNKLKSLLCIILLGISTQNLPTSGYRLSAQPKRTEARGSAFSISEVAPMLWVTAGVIFGGFMAWKISSLEKRAKKQGKSIKALKRRVGKVETLAQRFEKDIENAREDIAHDIKALNSDIQKTKTDLNKKMAMNTKFIKAHAQASDKANMQFSQGIADIFAGKYDRVDIASPSSSHTASTSSSGSRSPVESL